VTPVRVSFNVVKGDMSLVGPRPALPAQRQLLRIPRAEWRLGLSAGANGPAQINAYDAMPELRRQNGMARYASSVSV